MKPETLQKNGIIATPNANVTPEQIATAKAAGFVPTTPAPVPTPIVPTGTGTQGEINTTIRRYADTQTPDALAARKRESDLAAAKARQQRIDAINAIYAPQITDIENANKSAMASTRARNINSGLGGSEFAESAKVDTAKVGEKRLEGKRQEQALAIMNALDIIDKNQLEKVKIENEMATKSFEERTKALNTILENAKEGLKSFAGLGRTLADLKRDPQAYQNIVEQTGWSDYEIDSFLHNNSATPKDMKEYYSPNPDGSTKVTSVFLNPATGRMEEKTYTVSVPYSQFSKTEKIVLKDGSIALYDPATDRVTKISGATPVPSKPIPGAPPGITTADIDKAKKMFTTVGAYEGFTNPYLYLDAYKDWDSKKGSIDSFKKEFPPEQYINPTQIDLLPQILRPVKKTTTTTTLPASSSSASASGRTY